MMADVFVVSHFALLKNSYRFEQFLHLLRLRISVHWRLVGKNCQRTPDIHYYVSAGVLSHYAYNTISILFFSSPCASNQPA